MVDLPGLYSLTPRSEDERVAADVLSGRHEDLPPVAAVVLIVDASNLSRNLYLASQVLEVGLPTVVVLNMLDVAKRQGISVQVGELERELGVPVVPMQANRRIGLAELKDAIDHVCNAADSAGVSPVSSRNAGKMPVLAPLPCAGCGHCGGSSANSETAARQEWISRVVRAAVTQPDDFHSTVTDRVDHLLTHRLWGTAIFALVMVAMFQTVFVGAEPLTRMIQAGVSYLGQLLEGVMAEGRSAACSSAECLAAWGACCRSFRKSPFSSSSSRCWRTAATWPGPPASWTG